MSKRKAILNALVDKLKDIDGTGNFKTNIYNNAFPILRFWDNVQDYPCIYSSTGTELREYLPGDFVWVYLGISLKVYCHGDNGLEQLEDLLEDIENIVHDNNNLVYDTTNNLETVDIRIQSITTDEGLLDPYAVGEMNLQVRYQLAL